MRVGLFDSGIGGINVLSELIKKYPNNHYIYFGDTKNLPYGDKTINELMKLSTNIIDFLLQKQVDIIIIACGTISSNCYQTLKEKYSLPIYDIISPTINYLQNSTYYNIGIIGTTKTIESKIFLLPNKNIIMKATPRLVPLIENNLQNKNLDIIKDELFGLENSEVLVLGCTHYPLLKKEIQQFLNIQLIDMGVCLSNELKLDISGLSKVELYFSKLTSQIENNINQIIPMGIEYTINEIALGNYQK